MLDNIYRELDKGMVGGVVFLDLRKSFDTRCRRLLIDRIVFHWSILFGWSFTVTREFLVNPLMSVTQEDASSKVYI